MRRRISHFSQMNGARRFAGLICLLLLAGCTSSKSYMGIDLVERPYTPEQKYIQTLAKRAQSGDKQAQLALGERFEGGRRVGRDLEKARALYFQSAEDTPIKQTTYIPEDGIVKAETTNVGASKGLDEAKKRLKELGAAKPDSEQDDTENVDSLSLQEASQPFLYLGDEKIEGAGSRAIYQFLKVDYLSDICLYRIFEDQDLRQKLGVTANISNTTVDQKFLAANQCIKRSHMPNDCRKLQEQLVKFAQFARISKARLSFYSRSQGVIVKCVSKNWVKENFHQNERNKYPSPMDWALWRENPALVSEAKAQAMTQKDVLAGDTANPPEFAESYWAIRCQKYRGSSFAEEIDLILCNNQYPPSAQQRWEKTLEDLGISHAPDR